MDAIEHLASFFVEKQLGFLNRCFHMAEDFVSDSEPIFPLLILPFFH